MEKNRIYAKSETRVSASQAQKPAKSTMVEGELIFQKVKNCLEQQQMFLQKDFSLVRFSSAIGTNTTYLSNVINRYYGCNLRTLINRYRIIYAKRLLAEEGCHVKDLPSKCGFASRSAFYVAFQREEGCTPTVYLSKLNNNL